MVYRDYVRVHRVEGINNGASNGKENGKSNGNWGSSSLGYNSLKGISKAGANLSTLWLFMPRVEGWC